KFERQPALIQNMLVRTHSVSGERLVPLKPDSETLRLQKGALLGVIQKIDPAAAKRILELDPEHLYWSRFEYVYQHFDREAWTKGTRFAKHFTRTMHLGVPTDTPKTVLGEARPQMAYYGYPRSGIQKLHPKHFESDSRIDAARMKDFTDRNPAMH